MNLKGIVKRVTSTYYSDTLGIPNRTEIIDFNYSGYLLKQSTILQGHGEKYWYEYEYDNSDSTILNHKFYIGNSIKINSEYIYNEKGILLRTEDRIGNKMSVFKFNSIGLMIRLTSYSNKNKEREQTFIYNSGRQLLKCKEERFNDLKVQSNVKFITSRYEYDERGNLILVDATIEKNNKDLEAINAIYGMTKYDYDINGNKIKSEYNNPINGKVINDYVYVFDEYGNWIERTENKYLDQNNIDTSWIKRVIEYYP